MKKLRRYQKLGSISWTVFNELDQIARQCGITDGEWAVASGMKYASRIAELRLAFKRQAVTEKPITIGRAFTPEKTTRIVRGLNALLGVEMVYRSLIERAKNQRNLTDRIILKTLALSASYDDLRQMDSLADIIVSAARKRDEEIIQQRLERKRRKFLSEPEEVKKDPVLIV